MCMKASAADAAGAEVAAAASSPGAAGHTCAPDRNIGWSSDIKASATTTASTVRAVVTIDVIRQTVSGRTSVASGTAGTSHPAITANEASALPDRKGAA